LKLPQLLSQYLYQNRKLDLPGIGTFTLDEDAVIPQESDRVGQVPATGVHFRNANIAIADDRLVEFIKEHTGKMKSLAAADLDFFLTTGRQLLNIGKPFFLDGIGTLIKNKEGYFDFTQGDYMVARLEEAAPERRAHYEEPPREREPQNQSTRQGMLLALIVIGVVAIGWGGYYLYKRNSFSEPAEKRAVVMPDAGTAADTSHPAARDTVSAGQVKPAASARQVPSGAQQPASAADTVSAGLVKPSTTAEQPGGSARQPTGPNPGSTSTAGQTAAPPGSVLYRFVILSTDNKHHALRRYNQLLGYQLNIKMDQKDSSWFKLYFPIPALARDTTYIKDSLSETYAAPRVTIEH